MAALLQVKNSPLEAATCVENIAWLGVDDGDGGVMSAVGSVCGGVGWYSSACACM